ncbi:TPM domain-containing protein [Qipengyuania sp. G39]|uniref:TPM domain-containing protein n=1 Tax=Qipengyuania profundimaris TaxID=3067652 RepID=A0ABT9HRI2_9SPHN|nr:TPM domain-containing protein [Qipengyuania sp. G39]MDP4575767.1 TPM domain-containing protein [Qipengyuania sp. G39]
MRVLFLSFLLLTGACFDPQPGAQLPDAPGQKQQIARSPSIVQLGRVSDHADILSFSQEQALTEQLEAFEAQTEHQMVVATVDSLNGEEIADFARDLANAWGVGRADHDDGVVILVAPNERRVRIAVGYGLEEELSDTFCQGVLDSIILPSFRENDFANGIAGGVKAITERLS